MACREPLESPGHSPAYSSRSAWRWNGALAAMPFALTLFVVAMVFGPDLAPPPRAPGEENGSAAPLVPEPVAPSKTPSKEEVTYEPWELVST